MQRTNGLSQHTEGAQRRKKKNIIARFVRKFNIWKKGPVFAVLWDFEPTENDEIALKMGEKVTLIEERYRYSFYVCPILQTLKYSSFLATIALEEPKDRSCGGSGRKCEDWIKRKTKTLD